LYASENLATCIFFIYLQYLHANMLLEGRFVEVGTG